MVPLVYTVTVKNEIGSVNMNLVVYNNELGVNADAVAEALRGFLLGSVANPTASHTEKEEATATVVFPV